MKWFMLSHCTQILAYNRDSSVLHITFLAICTDLNVATLWGGGKNLMCWNPCGQLSWMWRDPWCLSTWVQSRWGWRCCISVDNWTFSSGHRYTRWELMHSIWVYPSSPERTDTLEYESTVMENLRHFDIVYLEINLCLVDVLYLFVHILFLNVFSLPFPCITVPGAAETGL